MSYRLRRATQDFRAEYHPDVDYDLVEDPLEKRWRLQKERHAEERRQADIIYSTVSERLAELGIDPIELRDYLAALP